MKTIKLSDYNDNMGTLIDVRSPVLYNERHDYRAINIYYEKLLYQHYKYLDKDKIYYIICDNGITSKKVVYRLSILGYNLVQVVY